MTWPEALLIGLGLDVAIALFAVINIVSYRRHRPQRTPVVDDLDEAGTGRAPAATTAAADGG